MLGAQEGGQQALCALCAQSQSPFWILFGAPLPPACAPVSQAPFTACPCAPPADICGARGHPCRCPTGEPCGTCLPPAAGPHLLQQRQLGEELVGAVLRQEVGPLLAGLGVGAAEVLEEAGLGQGGRDGVLALLVVWQGQPVAPGQPPGEALRRGGGGGVGVGEDPGPGPFSRAQLEPEHTSLPPAAAWAPGPLPWLIQGVSHR